ncbi:MAG: GNAT family N-acetyltransferase [Anaerolineales bacterium]
MNVPKDILFNVGDSYARCPASTDGRVLPTLRERCTDFFQLVGGTPPSPLAAQTQFTQLPEGKGHEDKLVVGLYGAAGNLVGVLDVIRNHPNSNEWYLGLLLLEPQQRNRGLGEECYRAFENWVTQFGARHVRLGVVEQNRRGYRFWRRMGFEILEKKPPQRYGERVGQTIVMRHSLDG